MPIAQLPSIDLHYQQIDPLDDRVADCGELVMIHGLAANLAFWRLGMAKAFPSICRITVYDLRGHGRSGTPASGYSPEQLTLDLRDLLDHLGLKRVHLLAHSFGGTIAILFALRYPERVHSLILADVRLKAVQPQLRLRDWKHWPQLRHRLEELGISLDDNDSEGGYQLLLELTRWQSRQKGRPKGGPRFLSQISGITGGRRAAKRWLQLQRSSSFRKEVFAPPAMVKEELANLQIPVLALYGEHSHALPTARMLKRLCPNCYLRIIPGVGHFFPLTHSRKLGRYCYRFLRAWARGRI